MSCVICLHIDQVLDEADRLLNEEFEKSLDEILNVIPPGAKNILIFCNNDQEGIYG